MNSFQTSQVGATSSISTRHQHLPNMPVFINCRMAWVLTSEFWYEKAGNKLSSITDYEEPILVTQLVREVVAVMQKFTQTGGVRPFGVSLLVAGFDDNGPQLY
ncbi:hypothetical protein RYX36_034586 [Vicia faba]